MNDVRDAFDKELPTPEPVIQWVDDPVVVWGPRTTINHLADALDKVRAWRKAKCEGAPASELDALVLAPTPVRAVLDPTEERVPKRRATSPKAEDDAPTFALTAPPSAPVKLPKTKLKLKL